MYVCMCMYVCVCMYVYIYIYLYLSVTVLLFTMFDMACLLIVVACFASSAHREELPHRGLARRDGEDRHGRAVPGRF